jgi:hypothetical protein
MNMGKLAGFAILVGLVALFFLRNTAREKQQFATMAPSAAVAYSVRVVDLKCEGAGVDSARVTVENMGAEIPYAKAYVDFIAENGVIVASKDSYFSPSTIPSGARASARLYSRGPNAASCKLARIQDGNGNAVNLE